MCRPTGRHVFCSYSPHFGNNAPTSDKHRNDRLRKYLEKCAIKPRFRVLAGIALACAIGLFGCETPDDNDLGTPEKETAATETCGEDSRLRARLYGALSASLDWHAANLECTGMPRPGGSGARLRFSGPAEDDRQSVVIIIAIPDLKRGEMVAELRSNITVIEEKSGRFFSTPSLDNCLTDVRSMTVIGGAPNQYTIAEVNGRSSITLSDVEFTGLINWGRS